MDLQDTTKGKVDTDHNLDLLNHSQDVAEGNIEELGERKASKDNHDSTRPSDFEIPEDPPSKKIKLEEGDIQGEESKVENYSQNVLISAECNIKHEATSGGNTEESGCPSRSNSQTKVKEEDEEVARSASEVKGGNRKHVTFEKRKKVALLISYCGAGYFGMQKNPGVNTIEDELIDALYKAGGISEDLKNNLGKMSFQRCARTDKGVSAANQVVSLKMIPKPELIPAINKHLPPSIRVFGMKRVTKGFDSKLLCSARTYQYLLPTFAFAPTEMQSVPSYRIKLPEINLINETLKLLCGTHNFHNFTSGKSPNEASSKRYIMEFSAGETFVKKGYEFITISVKGQSFMLHQIRKMIGLCIAICRGYCGTEVIEKAWGKNKVDIPKAPGLGLVLAKVHFDRYNQKFGSDGIHEPISWDENETSVSDFKSNFIWDTIIESEITQKSMIRWLNTLNNHTYTENRNQHQEAEQKES
eukprot:gene12072-13316_t